VVEGRRAYGASRPVRVRFIQGDAHARLRQERFEDVCRRPVRLAFFPGRGYNRFVKRVAVLKMGLYWLFMFSG
jgi:hypothetical protein